MKPGLAHSSLDLPVAPPAMLGHTAEVVSVDDPLGRSRVQVKVHDVCGVPNQDGPVWARMAVPFAGAKRGAFFLPDVGDEVLVVFLNGDTRQPVVVGGLWNGKDKAPESLDGDRVDRWTIVGKAGTRIAIVEARSGQPTISFSTPGGVSGELTDDGGGRVKFVASGTTVTIDSSGLTVQTGGTATVQASQVSVSAGTVNVDSAMSSFSGVVKCDTLIATTVVATSYTPGAGNVW